MAQENKIPRTMPYRESEQYIASLVERCTEQAVNSSKSRRITISPAVRIAAVAAAVAVVLTVALHLMGPTGTDSGTTSAPAELTAQVATDDKTADPNTNAIDRLLQDISDEEAQSLACIYYADYSDADL